MKAANLIIAAQRIGYAYVRLHETLDLAHGEISDEVAAELSEASSYLAEAYTNITGRKIAEVLYV